MHFDWFILPLLLPTPTIWFSLDRKRRSRKQSQIWKRSDSSDSDSVALLTLLTTKKSYHSLSNVFLILIPIFLFRIQKPLSMRSKMGLSVMSPSYLPFTVRFSPGFSTYSDHCDTILISKIASFLHR